MQIKKGCRVIKQLAFFKLNLPRVILDFYFVKKRVLLSKNKIIPGLIHKSWSFGIFGFL